MTLHTTSAMEDEGRASVAFAPSDAESYQRDAVGTDMTHLNALRSPLLRLPAEIRNYIFTFALAELAILSQSPRIHRALTFVSRQVHAETRLLLFAAKTWCFRSPLLYSQFVLDRTMQARQAVTTIRFELVVAISLGCPYVIWMSLKERFKSWSFVFETDFPALKTVELRIRCEMGASGDATVERITTAVRAWYAANVNVVAEVWYTG